MEHNLKFQKLTPTKDVDLKIYDKALQYVFENKDINNIAISGPYSSGKTSLLESYKVRHKEKKFLHISLAHFQEEAASQKMDQMVDQEAESTKLSLEAKLEGKILNQLAQQIDPKDIAQTNFRIKRTVSNAVCIINACIVMVYIIAALHIFRFESWKRFVTGLASSEMQRFLFQTISPSSLLFSVLLVTLISGYGVYWLIRTQKNKLIFRKLNVKGNEIEIFEEDNSSYFDKYLNEVLYLFENSKMDVIVFEEIDRFEDHKIFERLREINTLVNIRLKKKDKTLRFFYLLRDDIFTNKDRTKFFDYIIPVIPVMDSSNSYNQFINYLKKGEIFDLFDQKFLQGISLYVDDMRILKNIYNEFLIYYHRLNTTELNPNKMLAMITYKNIFPKDYNQLQFNQGYVFTIFNNKQEFIKDEMKNLKEKIDSLTHRIELYKNEPLESVKELNFIGEGLRRENYNRYQKFYEKEYIERKQALEDRLNQKITQLEEEVETLEQEYRKLEEARLYEVISRANSSEIFLATSMNYKYADIKENDYFALLKYLITYGYIDESYNDYMTYFYANSLSTNDKMFLRSITDRQAKEYSYKLKNIPLVLSYLTEADFAREEILNFDLVEYLLLHKRFNQYLHRLINTWKETKAFGFIEAFLDQKRVLKEFVWEINQQWPEMFYEVLQNLCMSEKHIKEYSVYSIYVAQRPGYDLNIPYLNTINIEDILTDYISLSKDYLDIEHPDIYKLIECFQYLKVSFHELDYEKSNKDLFDAIYSSSLYQLNIKNIWLMIEVYYGDYEEEDLKQRNFTIIDSKQEEPLFHYIDRNIDRYVGILLKLENDCFCDDGDSLIYLLNHEDLSEENAISFIKKLRTKIKDLSEIETTQYKIKFMEKFLVEYTAENIIAYYSSFGLDKYLIAFINSDDTFMDYSSLYEEKQELIDKFWNSVIVCNDISDQKYHQILQSIGLQYKKFNLLGISSQKVSILIKENTIPMTLDALKFMRENYPENILEYVAQKISLYANNLTDQDASLEETLEILTWDVLDEIKIKILSHTKHPISVLEKNYSSTVTVYILKHNLNITDLPELFSAYRDFDAEIQGYIEELAIENIAIIFDEIESISDDLIDKLMQSGSLSQDEKINLLIGMMPALTPNECCRYFKILHLNEFIKLFAPYTRPKFTMNATHEKILQTLKENDLIENYMEDPKKKGFYKAIKVNTLK